MSARVVAILTFCLSVTRLQTTHGENIAVGKLAKQSNTYPGYPASRALNDIYASTGSFTNFNNPSWWEVDLRGYFDISNITLTAANNGWTVHMGNAYVEVMDKDVSLCSDAQVEWCGNVSSTVAKKEKFSFTCNATFPIRFIRVTRRSTVNVRLSVAHVDVQGVGATKRYRALYVMQLTSKGTPYYKIDALRCTGSYFTPTIRRKVTKPSVTTSAVTAGECGIFCHRNHSCIDFSYSKTAPAESNCLLTYEVVPQNSVANNAWTMYIMDNCL